MKKTIILAVLVLGTISAFAQKTLTGELEGQTMSLIFHNEMTEVEYVQNGTSSGLLKVISVGETGDGCVKFEYIHSKGKVKVFACDDHSISAVVKGGTVLLNGYWYDIQDNKH
tara:strand:+ start:251 stop:589 length:339 start_codon:yes stop_codon:yes gene_type:complete